LLAVMAAVCVAGAAYQWFGIGVLLLVVVIAAVGVIGLAISRGIAVEIIAAVLFLLALIGLLMPAVQSPRGPTRRGTCANNLRMITLALQNYHDVYKSFPPAYVADASGKPMHSWRILVLEFIRPDIYQQYRFDEPWDGPNNCQFASTIVSMFECPSDNSGVNGQTSYVAVVGPETTWPGAKGVNIADIKDGTASTIQIVEVHNSGIHWMEPRDLDASQIPMAINPKTGLGISSGHTKCAQAACADGSVFVLDENTPPATIRAMLTIAGGERVEAP
jgi:hypothetical protein